MQITLKTDAARSGANWDELSIVPIFDLILIRHANDGVAYASGVMDLLRKADFKPGKPHVLKAAVEVILTSVLSSSECTQSSP